MTKVPFKEQPKPGSDAAIEKGCKCPVMDNAHGKGCGWGEGTFWVSKDCPIHGKPKEND